MTDPPASAHLHRARNKAAWAYAWAILALFTATAFGVKGWKTAHVAAALEERSRTRCP